MGTAARSAGSSTRSLVSEAPGQPAQARQVDVHVVAVDANEIHLAAVGLHERREDLAANLRDLRLGSVVHGKPLIIRTVPPWQAPSRAVPGGAGGL